MSFDAAEGRIAVAISEFDDTGNAGRSCAEESTVQVAAASTAAGHAHARGSQAYIFANGADGALPETDIAAGARNARGEVSR